MSGVNLNENGAEMQTAWKEILDGGEMNWVLFGYKGNTNVLRYVSSGSEGIEEMKEELNSNQIMYAFCRISPGSEAPRRFVFINWQGEGAPGTRKGTCATHVRDIRAYFPGSHLTLDARDEDEIDVEEIQKRIAATTKMDFRVSSSADFRPEPVGTTHKRIIPLRELPNLSQRESFWQKEEMEEKKRIQEEKQKKISINAALDSERRAREEAEATKREESLKEREKRLEEIKKAEEEAEERRRQRDEIRRWEKQVEDDEKEASERKARGESLTNQRTKEAAELVAHKASKARAIFEQYSSSGQMNFRKGESPPPENEPKIATPPSVPDVATNSSPPDLIADVAVTPDVTNGTSQSQRSEDKSQYGVCAVALYDYQASDSTEINFDPNQVITNIEKIDPGWWQGVGPDGKFGLFPANYVEIIDASQIAQQIV